MGKSFVTYGIIGALFITVVITWQLPLARATATGTQATAATSTNDSALQSEIDANNQQIATLNQQIANYQAELQQVGANKKTLQAAINSLDLQRNTVQARVAIIQQQIAITQLQVQQIGGQITDTQQSIISAQAALAAQLRLVQKDDARPLLIQLLSSDTLANAWGDINASLQVQNAIENQASALQAQKSTLADSESASEQKQTMLASQKLSLAAQQQTLIATEQSKSQLLVETNSQESNYEKLLAAAEAQLQSFSAFTENAGGSGILGNQTVCDAWGCYYNQRDAAWGKDALDGTKYTLASDGCLVTAMAMVLTHYGYHTVTPVSINDNPNNFAAYYPASLLSTINVNGVTATRKAAAIDATLASGNPVIVGLRAYGGTHFVVLVSGSNGNYLMRDPYITNGNNISFSDHYSLRSIFAVSKVIIES